MLNRKVAFSIFAAISIAIIVLFVFTKGNRVCSNDSDCMLYKHTCTLSMCVESRCYASDRQPLLFGWNLWPEMQAGIGCECKENTCTHIFAPHPKLCNGIKDTGKKISCYRQVIRKVTESDTPELCDQFEENDPLDFRKMCKDSYSQKEIKRSFIESAKMDPEHCEEIIDDKPISKNQCYREAAYSREDPNLCKKVTPDWKVYRCTYLDMKRDFMCGYNDSKEECLGNRPDWNNLSICNEKLLTSTRDYCLNNVAWITNDSSICNSILNQDVRQKCPKRPYISE